MLVPILLVLPYYEQLRDLSLYRKGLLPDKQWLQLLAAVRDKVKIPPGVQLGSGSLAIPLQIGKVIDKHSLDWFAETFALRVFIEADSFKNIPPEIAGQPVFGDPAITMFTRGPINKLLAAARGTSEDVRENLDVAALASAGLDGKDVAIAIMDTGINIDHLKTKITDRPINFDAVNSWTPPNGVPPFKHPKGHGTMCAFAALLAAPEATLLDIPIGADIPAQDAGQSKMDPTLSVAMQGFDWLREFCRPGGPAETAGIRAVVSSNSWGIANPGLDFDPPNPNRYIDNPNHPFNKQVSDIATSGIGVVVDIVFAAGNCGDVPHLSCKGSQPIMGANALPTVLTIAGCDTNGTRVGYSSQGPAITFVGVTPDPAHSKPDVTAYTHFQGSEALGIGMADAGTSTACPVAAGCVAALRTRDPQAPKPRPTAAEMIQEIRTMTSLAPGQLPRDYGCGIINPVSAAKNLGLIPTS